jgi:hypothetical protein
MTFWTVRFCTIHTLSGRSANCKEGDCEEVGSYPDLGHFRYAPLSFEEANPAVVGRDLEAYQEVALRA